MSEKNYVVQCKPNNAPHFKSLLGHIDIELTERCNNACIHCLINQNQYNKKVHALEMNTAFVKEILTQAAELGCLSVRFTGGEPLLRDDFEELYLFTRKLGMYVLLFTNARRITLNLAQLLKRIPPGRVVEVTVYGMHAESYDTATKSPGAFTEFWYGIELLLQHNIPFIVKQAILPPNRSELAEFESFAKTIPWMDKMPRYSMNFDLRTRRDNPAKNRIIQTLRPTPDETIAILSRNPNYRKSMNDFIGKFMGPPGIKLFACGAGHGTCVDAYGNAQMCMGLRHPDTVYNLHQDVYGHKRAPLTPGVTPLKYVLTEFFPRLREMRATNPDYLHRCAVCFLKGLCDQCPAKSWQEHGTLDTPVEYTCQVAHAKARYLELIGKDENAWEVRDWRERVTRVTRN